MTTACLTLLSTVLCLLLQREDSTGKESLNPIDGRIRSTLGKRLRGFVKKHEHLHPLVSCLRGLTKALSDQQLVTGIAILVAALKRLYVDQTITVYHFSIVTDLAWFSANTHLLSLLVVAHSNSSVKSAVDDRTQDSTPTKKEPRLPLLIRVFLMLVLAALLLYCSWITGYANWEEDWNCPTSCVLGFQKGGNQFRWTIVNFVLILYAYPLAIFLLWRKLRVIWIKKYRPKLFDPPSGGTTESGTNSLPGLIISAFQKYIFIPVWYILASEFWGVMEQLAWFILGVYWTMSDRIYGHDPSLMVPEESAAEDSWGFGQIVPLLLLILPLLQFMDLWAGKNLVAMTLNPATNCADNMGHRSTEEDFR